jgi:hypothetical protein
LLWGKGPCVLQAAPCRYRSNRSRPALLRQRSTLPPAPAPPPATHTHTHGRLIWSRSQEATGEVFLDLKRNRGEPDAAAAALVGLPLAHDGTPLVGAAAAAAVSGGVATATYEMAAAAVASGAAAAAAAAAVGAPPGSAAAAAALAPEAVVNPAGIELLRRLPGVTDANWRPLAEGVGSLAGLAGAPLERLEALMGGARAARTLHAFLHAPCPRLAGGPAGGGGGEAEDDGEEVDGDGNAEGGGDAEREAGGPGVGAAGVADGPQQDGSGGRGDASSSEDGW